MNLKNGEKTLDDFCSATTNISQKEAFLIMVEYIVEFEERNNIVIHCLRDKEILLCFNAEKDRDLFEEFLNSRIMFLSLKH